MKHVIIIDQGKSLVGRRGALDFVKGAISSDLNIVSVDNSSTEQVFSLFEENPSDTFLIMNSTLTHRISEVNSLLKCFEEREWNTLTLTRCSVGEDELRLPELRKDNLAHLAAEDDIWPLGAMIVPASIYDAERHNSCNTITEFLLCCIFDCVIEDRSWECLDEHITLSENYGDETCIFYTSERAHLLNYVVNNCEIEELFPNHPWDRFPEESAAASYHTLAAMFLKLNDIENAEECLNCSDMLEESPRSLAIKGLISLNKGETLGAVSNFINSLKCYEGRKRDDNQQHYLTFNPEDFNEINTKMHKGLDALNSKDNETAMQNFAEAVFDFDSFYSEQGIDEINMQ